MNIQELFKLGMKRDLPILYDYPGIAFDIGATGKSVVPGAKAIGLPEWSFPRDRIPASYATLSTIHCYHVLEHLSGDNVIDFLRECERVMIPNASVLNFCVPYFSTPLQAQDLTHKSVWCEDTFKTLFNNPWYNPAGEWKLRVHFQMIAGVVNRNICLIGQLVRVE